MADAPIGKDLNQDVAKMEAKSVDIYEVIEQSNNGQVIDQSKASSV